jgi:hypothetical protein
MISQMVQMGSRSAIPETKSTSPSGGDDVVRGPPDGAAHPGHLLGRERARDQFAQSRVAGRVHREDGLRRFRHRGRQDFQRHATES